MVCMTINGQQQTLNRFFQLFFVVVIIQTWTAATSPLKHTCTEFIRLRGDVSQLWFNMQASSWWYQINREF